jgi:integrase
VPDRVESYTDVELAKIFAKMAALEVEPVYIYAARSLLATGMRVGELVALDWDDVRLSEGKIRVSRHWDPVDGATLPKDGEERDVYLFGQSDDPETPPTPRWIDGVALFERWTGLCGVQAGSSPVFPAPRGERLNGQYLRKVFDNARRKAGVTDAGEGGRKRKPLHALRGSYSRISREAGFPSWLRQANLGHSTLDLTDEVYGKPGIAALRAAARRGSAV